MCIRPRLIKNVRSTYPSRDLSVSVRLTCRVPSVWSTRGCSRPVAPFSLIERIPPRFSRKSYRTSPFDHAAKCPGSGRRNLQLSLPCRMFLLQFVCLISLQGSSKGPAIRPSRRATSQPSGVKIVQSHVADTALAPPKPKPACNKANSEAN